MVACECPICDSRIQMDRYDEGDTLECPTCGTRLEIISLTPPVLEISPEENDNWE